MPKPRRPKYDPEYGKDLTAAEYVVLREATQVGDISMSRAINLLLEIPTFAMSAVTSTPEQYAHAGEIIAKLIRRGYLKNHRLEDRYWVPTECREMLDVFRRLIGLDKIAKL